MLERETSPAGPKAEPWRIALLCCVTALAYLPALRNGFVWDDNLLLTHNRMIKAAGGLWRFWFTGAQADYWPVTYTALWVQWRLWGMHAFGYHAMNLALHIADCLLLWGVLRRMKIPGAYLAAFIFAVHPVNVETVAWISELKNLLAMFFYLASIRCFLSSRIALSLLAFILAMLSKGSVAMLPFVLLGLTAWHRRLRLRDLALMLPFFIVSGVLVLTDVWFQKHGTGEIFRSAGAWERLLGAGAVIWFYLGKALWPANLMFVYPEWHIHADRLLWWMPLLAAAGVTIVLWRNRHRWSRPMLFAWCYFCVALVPVMGFTDVYFMKYSLVADRYAPLALIGIIAATTYYLLNTTYSFPSSPFSFRQITAAAVICLFSVLTWRQCRMYRDARTLFLTTIQRNPNCWMAYNYLGATLPAANLGESIADFEKAVEIKPDYAEARDNLGLAFIEAGRLPEARAQFEEEMRLQPDNPRASANLARVQSLQQYP